MLLSVEKRGKKIKNKGILGLMALRISEDVVRNALIQEMLCIVQGRKLKCCMGGGGGGVGCGISVLFSLKPPRLKPPHRTSLGPNLAFPHGQVLGLLVGLLAGFDQEVRAMMLVHV